jgi:hypothetical protein
MQQAGPQKEPAHLTKMHFSAQIPPKGGDIIQPSGPLQAAAAVLVCESLLTPGAAADSVAALFYLRSFLIVKFKATSAPSAGNSLSSSAAQFKLGMEEHFF